MAPEFKKVVVNPRKKIVNLPGMMSMARPVDKTPIKPIKPPIKK